MRSKRAERYQYSGPSYFCLNHKFSSEISTIIILYLLQGLRGVGPSQVTRTP